MNTYDAIVIGSGISGGWAAKELCEHGLKTLVLERGRNVEHIKDYPTATKAPWEFRHRGEMSKEFIQQNPFDWIRGYQVGGKSLTWGRACQRWSDFEFTGPERFGYDEAWPISYKD